MNRLMLNKATSSSEEPTPGYLFNEISSMTFSSKESLVLVGDYLLKKLKRTDLNVKLKTLKILKHLCDEKRQDFRNYLKKKIDVIKECQTCNIVNDELKGETPSILVRKEATDLIKLIYSYNVIEPTVKGTTVNDSIIKKNRIEGFGNTLYEPKSGPHMRNNRMLLSYNSKEVLMNKNQRMQRSDRTRMAEQSISATMNKDPYRGTSNISTSKNPNTKLSGFGNPYFNQNPPQKTKGEIAIKYLNEVAKNYIPSSFVNRLEKVSASISKNYSNGTLSLQTIIDASNYNPNRETDPYRNRRSCKSIDMQGNPYSEKEREGGRYPYQMNDTNDIYKVERSNSKKVYKIKKPQESQESGVYERKVVDDVLSTTEGIKKIPSEQVLLEFAQKCDALDTKLIVSILTEKLRVHPMKEEDVWKHKLKLLCIIEYLLNHRKKKEEEKETMMETLESLIHNLKYQTVEELYRCNNWKELKRKVHDIFVLMGLQENTSKEKQKKEKQIRNTDPRNTQESKEIPNLLDFDNEPNFDIGQKNNEIIQGKPNVCTNKNDSMNNNLFAENTSTKSTTSGDHFHISLDHNTQENGKNVTHRDLFSNLNVKYTGTKEQESTQNKGKPARNSVINRTYEPPENKKEIDLNLEMLNDSFSNMNLHHKSNDYRNEEIKNNKPNSNELISFDDINEPSDRTENPYIYKTKGESNDLFQHCQVKNTSLEKPKEKESAWNDLSHLQNMNELNLLDINTNEPTIPLHDVMKCSQNTTNEGNSQYVKNQHYNSVDSTQWNHKKPEINNFLKEDKNHEDSMNQFLKSFTLSSKNEDSCNMKQNVNIDAFELLSDQLKL